MAEGEVGWRRRNQTPSKISVAEVLERMPGDSGGESDAARRFEFSNVKNALHHRDNECVYRRATP